MTLSRLFVILLLATSCSSAQIARGPANDPLDAQFAKLPAGGRKSLHGMVLFGNGPYFVDHIPMLSAPHDFQIVSEVTLTTSAGEPVAADFSKGQFTVKPAENFSLNDYLAGRYTKFPGSIHAGNFETGADEIPGLERVVFEVKRRVLRRQLPAASAESELSVQDRSNHYVINVITPNRNFQRVINASIGKNLWCAKGPQFVDPCD